MASKTSQNKTFKELGEEFLRNSEVRGLSEWTIKYYGDNKSPGKSLHDTPKKVMKF